MLIMTYQNPIHLYNKIRKLHAYVNIQVLLMAYIPRFLKFDKHQNFADGTEFWQTERSALGFRTRSCMGMVALNNRDFFFFFFLRRLIIGIMILEAGYIMNEVLANEKWRNKIESFIPTGNQFLDPFMLLYSERQPKFRSEHCMWTWNYHLYHFLLDTSCERMLQF